MKIVKKILPHNVIFVITCWNIQTNTAGTDCHHHQEGQFCYANWKRTMLDMPTLKGPKCDTMRKLCLGVIYNVKKSTSCRDNVSQIVCPSVTALNFLLDTWNSISEFLTTTCRIIRNLFGNGFSNSHTIVRAVNEFINQFSYFLACLASFLHTSLHNMSLRYYEFRERKHAEGHI